MQHVKLFPETSEVFENNLALNGRHFMPLATIELVGIDASLEGKVHLLYFNNDPYCARSTDLYNEYCNDARVSFNLVNNKYRFLANYGYFDTNDDWIPWLEMGKKSYAANKERHLKNELHFESSEGICNLGGEPDWEQEENWPVNQQGEPLRFICQVWSGDFVSDNCAESIFLFYDQRNGMAVQIHQVD